jgi:hypothetical protein
LTAHINNGCNLLDTDAARVAWATQILTIDLGLKGFEFILKKCFTQDKYF